MAGFLVIQLSYSFTSSFILGVHDRQTIFELTITDLFEEFGVIRDHFSCIRPVRQQHKSLLALAMLEIKRIAWLTLIKALCAETEPPVPTVGSR